MRPVQREILSNARIIAVYEHSYSTLFCVTVRSIRILGVWFNARLFCQLLASHDLWLKRFFQLFFGNFWLHKRWHVNGLLSDNAGDDSYVIEKLQLWQAPVLECLCIIILAAPWSQQLSTELDSQTLSWGLLLKTACNDHTVCCGSCPSAQFRTGMLFVVVADPSRGDGKP